MIASCSVVSCNFSPSPLKAHCYSLLKPVNFPTKALKSPISFLVKSEHSRIQPLLPAKAKVQRLLCKNSSNSQSPQEPVLVSDENELPAGGSGGGGDEGPEERDWTTSFLLFIFWAGLMYYVFFLAPDQQPVTDTYFVIKLLNLKGEDGFKVNDVLVALWYIMGLWPLVYSMLLFPAARSTKSKIPIWPFIILSFAGGAYALIPYFVLWRPPAPPLQDSDLGRWPLNFLESKLTAAATVVVGLAVLAYGLSSGADAWSEFAQYFQGSKFIHVMSIDFVLFTTFAPFWVYNDLTARRWEHKASWIVPLSVIPFVGPALYLLIRPSLSESVLLTTQEASEEI